MSPIFVRPVREQLEHDRLIRHLLAKYKRKFEVVANVGEDQAAPVKIGPRTFFPDLVLTADRKLAGVVEVETGESINNLEAMAQWVHFSRARVPFHLYVPVNGYDAARRLCDANHARVTEIWTYRPAPDGFDLVRLHVDAASAAAKAAPARPAAAKASAAKPLTETPPARPVKAKAATRPAAAKARKKAVPRAATSAARPARPAGRAKRK